MVLDAFQQRKAVVLVGLQADCGDKSRKGSVDAPVAALVDRINSHPALYTTSSCSGRITVFGEPTAGSRAEGRKGGEWVYASHEPADPEEVVAAVRRRCVSGDALVLRFEPFILALEANSPMMGQKVLAAARAAGFRESGLTLGGGGRRVMVGVRCSLRLEVPVADRGAVLVPDAYLRHCVGLANDKFAANLERIRRFEEELFRVLDPPDLKEAPPPPAPAPAYRPGTRQAFITKVSTGGAGTPAEAAAAVATAVAAAAAAPLRRRRGGATSAASAGEPVTSSVLAALKARQARVLGRIRGLEARLVRPFAGGAAGGVVGAAGAADSGQVTSRQGGEAVGRSVAQKEVERRGDVLPAARAQEESAAAAAAASTGAAGAVSSEAGGGGLMWRPVPVTPLQGTVDENVPRWGHASAVYGSRIYLLGGYGGGGAHARRSDVLVYDTACRTWSALDTAVSAPAPPPRMGHTAVAVGDRYVVLVGGRTSPVDALEDVWILDLAAEPATWIQVRPEVDPKTTCGAVCARSSFPGRYRHSMVTVPPRQSKLDVRQVKCGSINSSGDRVRSLDGWRVVVYGGRNAEAVLGDAWVLYRDPGDSDPTDAADLSVGWRWRQVGARGEAPSPRKSHAACFMPAADDSYASAGSGAEGGAVDRMYVHGGTCGYGLHFDDMYFLDLDSYTWHRVAAAAAAAAGQQPGGPPACFSHTLSRWGPYLLLVGGYPTDHHSQLCVLDTRTHVWHAYETGVAAPDPPQPPPPAATAPESADDGTSVNNPTTTTTTTGVSAAAGVSRRSNMSRSSSKAALAGADGCGGAAGAAAASALLEFVPIRHCAEVVHGEPYDSLYVMGGGAFCFSFGTVFGGCFEMQLRPGGALEAPGGVRSTPQSGADDKRSTRPEAGGSMGGQTTEGRGTGGIGGTSAPTDNTPTPGSSGSAVGVSGRSDGAADGASGSTGASGSGSCGWVVAVPSSGAKAVKDALKAAGWLDGTRKAGLEPATAPTPDSATTGIAAPAPDNGTTMTEAPADEARVQTTGAGEPAAGVRRAGEPAAGVPARVLLPVTDAAAKALRPWLLLPGAAAGGESVARPKEADASSSGSQASSQAAAAAAKLAAAATSGPTPETPSIGPPAECSSRTAELAGLLTAAGAELVGLLTAAGAELRPAPPLPPLARMCPAALSPALRLRAAAEELLREAMAAGDGAGADLVPELLADLPTRWERLGDLALLPSGCLSHPGWRRVRRRAGRGGGGGEAVPGAEAGVREEEEEGAEADGAMLPLWRAVAEALGVKRLARQAPVANTGTRDSRAVLLLGSDGWVAHREGGVLFRLDVTRCMFSSGNVTERTRMGWGRGAFADLAGAAAGAAATGRSAAAAARGDAADGAAAGAAGGVPSAAAPAKAAAGPGAARGGGGGKGGNGNGGGRLGWAAGETVVDLYCGIGYYTVPLLVVGGADKAYACEWNPNALEALRLNLQQAPLGGPPGSPPVAARCEVLPGDCRLTAPEGVADRVMLGLLPSSRGGWEKAIRALKPDRGGWLHLHHNVTDSQEAQWLADTMAELRTLAAAAGLDWQLSLRHVERVKWYAPHIRHIVMDIECRPAGLDQPTQPHPLALTPPTQTPLTAPLGPAPPPPLAAAKRSAATITTTTQAATSHGTASHCNGGSHPTAPTPPSGTVANGPVAAAGAATAAAAPGGMAAGGATNGSGAGPEAGPGSGSASGTALSPWYHQPLDLLPRVRRVRGVTSREVFEADISPGRQPVVLEGLDLGAAPHKWTSAYLQSLPAAQTTLVSVHVSRDPAGCLDFAGRKNFAFRTMPLAELVGRVEQVAAVAAKTGQEKKQQQQQQQTASAEAAAAGGGGEAAAATAAGPGDPAKGRGGGAEAGFQWPALVPAGEEFGEGPEVLYLRSIGENPRREAACLSASFPSLAPDLVLPPLFPPDALHSSVLRISCPGLVLWTHYDVMDNLLIQVTGTKRVLLWPPACHDALHVSGSSSPITRLDDPDLERFPRFAGCPAPVVAELAPGDVLFLPSLWFHNVTTTGSTPSISVNAFWRHLPPEFYHRKDLYGNRDLVQAEAADAAASEVVSQLAALPPHYRDFYAARLLGRLQRELGLDEAA